MCPRRFHFVFISHSAFGEPAAKTLVDALQARLEQRREPNGPPAFPCVVDWIEIKTGESWREPMRGARFHPPFKGRRQSGVGQLTEVDAIRARATRER